MEQNFDTQKIRFKTVCFTTDIAKTFQNIHLEVVHVACTQIMKFAVSVAYLPSTYDIVNLYWMIECSYCDARGLRFESQVEQSVIGFFYEILSSSSELGFVPG